VTARKQLRRGDIWKADIPNPATPHLVVLLSANSGVEQRSNITVGVVTSTIRALDAEVRLDPAFDDVDHLCVVNLDEIVTIPKRLLVEHRGKMRDTKMLEVEQALHRALGMILPCRHADTDLLSILLEPSEE
jgi:mRNA-degrading endonuclease toxin of MazEF toxin-antitoxin module